MNRRKLVWVIPLVIILMIIAYLLWPISEIEHREPPINTEQIFGKTWVLKSLLINGETLYISEYTTVTIRFNEEGTVHGFGGCNNFSGEYQISGEYKINATTNSDQSEEQIGVGGTISIEQISHTEKACQVPDTISDWNDISRRLQEQENKYFLSLGEVTSFQVTSESLKLTNQDEQIVLDFILE